MFPSKVKPSEKPRLCIFGRDSYVSDSALSKLIKEFKEEGLPDADSRNSILRDRKAYINERTQFGPISNIVKGVGVDAEDIDVPVANPFAFLQTAIIKLTKFGALLFRMFEDTHSIRSSLLG